MLWPLLLIILYIWIVVKVSGMFRKEKARKKRSNDQDLHRVLGKETHRELTRRAKELRRFYDD